MRLPTNVIQPLGISSYEGYPALIYASKRRGHSKLGLALSEDGIHFNESTDAPVIFKSDTKTEQIDNAQDFRFSSILGHHYLTYSRNGRLVIAKQQSDDDMWGIASWRVMRTANPRAQGGMLVPEFKHNNNHVLYYHTGSINVAVTKDFKQWHGPLRPILEPRKHNFDSRGLKVVATAKTQAGLVVLYEAGFTRKRTQKIGVGIAVFSSRNPSKLLWRSEGPLWQVTNRASDPITLLGAKITDEIIELYGHSKTSNVFVVTLPNPLKVDEVTKPTFELDRHHKNPILAPEGGEHWEQVGAFNPTVIHHNGVHILYRAVDPYGVSHVGYAYSRDGHTIDYRSPEPAYWPRASFESGRGKKTFKGWHAAFGSGGGWGGCEDPKATLIDGKIYMTYVAHDGSPYLRLSLTSIDLDDFLNRRWDKWAWPKVISTPEFGPHVNPPFGVRVIKSGIVLPEKVNGKYAIFFKEPPHVGIHYIDNLDDLGITEELQPHDFIYTRSGHWDSQKLSIGSTPILIDEGWLTIYHAVDKKDGGKYKIGAMLLDKNDPSKVLKRTNAPILEPAMSYENEWKHGVAYPGGAAIIGDQLYVYYGGGDRHVCVATTPLKEFVSHLLNEEDIHMSNSVVIA